MASHFSPPNDTSPEGVKNGGGGIGGASSGMRAHEFVLDAMHRVLINVLVGHPKLLEGLFWEMPSLRGHAPEREGEQFTVPVCAIYKRFYFPQFVIVCIN